MFYRYCEQSECFPTAIHHGFSTVCWSNFKLWSAYSHLNYVRLLFVCQVTSFREPTIPPPPAPTHSQDIISHSAAIRPQPPASSAKPVLTARPPVPAQPNAWNSGRAGGAQNSATHTTASQDDDWDDSWDEDDDNSSTTTETQVWTSVSGQLIILL